MFADDNFPVESSENVGNLIIEPQSNNKLDERLWAENKWKQG